MVIEKGERCGKVRSQADAADQASEYGKQSGE
jgi:hypothetical protein